MAFRPDALDDLLVAEVALAQASAALLHARGNALPGTALAAQIEQHRLVVRAELRWLSAQIDDLAR